MEVVKKSPQNTRERQYDTINEFEIRFGKFYDPSELINGTKYEIRILNPDIELMEALKDKIKDILSD